MSILSTNHRLISIGESYSAGNGIDITDQVISVTGDATPYSAGENIDIQDHIISGKDWSQYITEASSHAYNETTAWVQENYANSADMTYISAVVDTKLDASAWSTVSADYATEDYVIMADNITYDRATGYVDSKGYATEGFVNENTSGKLDSTAFTNWQNGQYSTDLQTIEGQISNKLDSSSFSDVSGTFYPMEGNPSGFLTDDNTVVLQYDTSTWAEFKSAYDAHKNIVMYKPDIGDIINQYATFGYVDFDSVPAVASFTTICYGTEYRFTLNSNNVWRSYSQPLQNRGNYYSASNPSGFITGVNIPESATWNEVSTTVQTNSAQWGQGGGAISSYTTAWASEVPPYGDSVINTLNEKYISAFLSNSADKSNFANNANSANSANYAETVNETYLENKGFTRNLSSEYGTVSIIHNNIIESTNSAIVRTGNEGFVSSFKGQSIGPEGNGIATYRWDKALPNTTINLNMDWSNGQILTYSANTNLSGEIVLPTGVNTQTINIPNATEFKVWSTNWVNLIGAVVSAAGSLETVVGELAWASALPTYEYDTTNKISAINGSALAGGGDVPTGTMNVSGLGYNAVNEISAYNGSAIAQYGAEKQWLQHDDTLVHAANSAQYALGVNLSAVAQLLGVDETVLYSGYENIGSDGSATYNLTELPTNFNKIKIYWGLRNNNEYRQDNKGFGSVEYDTNLYTADYTYIAGFMEGDIDNTSFNAYRYDANIANIRTTSWSQNGQLTRLNDNTILANNAIWFHIYKIVGIGRKH